MRRHAGLAVLFFLAACGSVDEDEDGFTVDADCNDASAEVSPDGVEICNGIDDDCDGEIDEGVTTAYYVDADEDGFGAGDPTMACSPPSGMVESSSDCDDGNDAVRPDATEMCNDIDDDCDAEVDEADAADAPTWYADTDLDGFGDPGAVQRACSAPAGTTSNDMDCDDTDELIFPGAAERCNDGVDDDCDASTTDEGTVRFTTATGEVRNVTLDYTGDTLVTIAEDGLLEFCEGTYDTSITTTFDVEVASASMDRNAVTLTGDLSVTDGGALTLQSVFLDEPVLAVQCEGTKGALGSLEINDVTIDRSTYQAVASAYCDVVMDDVLVDNGTGFRGVEIANGTADLTGVTVQNGEWNFPALSFFGVDSVLHDVWVANNAVSACCSSVNVTNGNAVWSSSGPGQSGVVGAAGTEDVGLRLFYASTFEAVDLDFGEGVDDNGGPDIETFSNWTRFYAAGNGVSFICDASGRCGVPVSEDVGVDVLGGTFSDILGTNVFQSSGTHTLESFSGMVASDQGGTCTVRTYVAESATNGTGTWSVIFEGDEVSLGTDRASSGELGILLQDGMYYALGFSVHCTSGVAGWYYDLAAPEASVAWGTAMGLGEGSVDDGTADWNGSLDVPDGFGPVFTMTVESVSLD